MSGAPANRYLVTPSGRFVGTRARPTVLFIVPILGAPVLGALGAVIGGAIGSDAVVALSLLAAFVVFAVSAMTQFAFLMSAATQLARAADAWMRGDQATSLAICQAALGRVFRSDVRTRALYILGLIAEANMDFAEADDLFARASAMMPTFAAGKWQRHARVLILCHRAISLVAVRRLDEADALVRQAAQLYPMRAPGALDVFTDDAAFGSIGVAAALRDLEPGRDPRALLSLATVLVLAARGMGREAVELVERERWTLNAGTLPRERALIARVEARARALLGGGPMRAPGMMAPAITSDAASAAWAERILPA